MLRIPRIPQKYRSNGIVAASLQDETLVQPLILAFPQVGQGGAVDVTRVGQHVGGSELAGGVPGVLIDNSGPGALESKTKINGGF